MILFASIVYVSLGSGLVGFALGHAQIAWLEAKSRL